MAAPLAVMDVETMMGQDQERYGEQEGAAFLWGLGWRDASGALQYVALDTFDAVVAQLIEIGATEVWGHNLLGFDILVALRGLAASGEVDSVDLTQIGSDSVIGTITCKRRRVGGA